MRPASRRLRAASGQTSRSPWAPAEGQGVRSQAAHGVPARYDGVTRPKMRLTIPVDKIRPDPDQPRTEFDADDSPGSPSRSGPGPAPADPRPF